MMMTQGRWATLTGVMLCLASILLRHSPQSDVAEWLIVFMSWAGAVLIIAGTGWTFFIENR
jgi:hypothetical protein